MRVVLEDEFVVVIVVVVVLVVVEVRLTKPLPLSSVFEIRNPKKKSLLVRLAIAVVAGVVAATAAVVVADILFLARCFSPLWGRCDCSRIRQWRLSRLPLLVSAFFDGVVVVAVLVSPRVIVDALEAAVAVVVVGLVLVLVVAVVSRSLRREPLWMLKKTTE